jgi:hypothetical protein
VIGQAYDRLTLGPFSREGEGGVIGQNYERKRREYDRKGRKVTKKERKVTNERIKYVPTK